jgi:hypothetical protein
MNQLDLFYEKYGIAGRWIYWWQYEKAIPQQQTCEARKTLTHNQTQQPTEAA